MHKLVMHGLSKENNLLLIRKWEWLQRQLEEKAQMGLCLLCSSQDEQGWAQITLFLPCQLCLPGKNHVAHVVINYRIL